MTKPPKYPLPAADVSDKIEQQRRAIVPPPPVRERRYDFYEAHPEHRPRRLSARRIRWQQIREGR